MAISTANDEPVIFDRWIPTLEVLPQFTSITFYVALKPSDSAHGCSDLLLGTTNRENFQPRRRGGVQSGEMFGRTAEVIVHLAVLVLQANDGLAQFLESHAYFPVV